MLRRVLNLLVCGETVEDDPVLLVAERRQLTPVRTAVREPLEDSDAEDARRRLEVTTRAGIEAAVLRLRAYQEDRLARDFAMARPLE